MLPSLARRQNTQDFRVFLTFADSSSLSLSLPSISVIPYNSITNISPCYSPCSKRIPENSATILGYPSDRMNHRGEDSSSQFEENSGEWDSTWFLERAEERRGGGCKKVGGISIFPDIKYFGFPEDRREKGFNQLDGSTLGGREKSFGGF